MQVMHIGRRIMPVARLSCWGKTNMFCSVLPTYDTLQRVMLHVQIPYVTHFTLCEECCLLTTYWFAGLKRNPEMVYALLHRQEVFEPFRMHVRFADILDNIQVSVVLKSAHQTRHASVWPYI